MADYEKAVLRLLRAAGCHKVREGRGDHEVWFSPVSETYFTVKVKAMKSRHTANETLKQAGLPKKF